MSVSSMVQSSWHLHRFLECKLKFKRERPLGIVRNQVGSYEALRRFRIDSEEWRVREVPEIIDNDFLLFRVPEVQAAHVNAVDCTGSRASCCRARGGGGRRSGSDFRRAFFRDA